MAVKKQDEFQQNPYADAVVRQTMPNTQIPNMDWNAQKADLYRQISDRQPFEFDLDKDALYQQYKDQYTRLGQQAMKDTMGQAAGLTGGYSSSYAQNVGQQAYDDHLTKLNAVVPELYAQARAAYDAEGDDLYRQFQLAAAAADDAYQKERDALADQRYEDELDWNRDWQQKQWDYNTQQQAQNDARSYAQYLLQMGIMPSDEQLAAAGISPQEAANIRNYYNAQLYAATAGSGSGSGGGRSGGSGGRGSSGGGYGYDYGYEDVDGSGANVDVRAALGNVPIAGSAMQSAYDSVLNAANNALPWNNQAIPQADLEQYARMMANQGFDRGLSAFYAAYPGNGKNVKDAYQWLLQNYQKYKVGGATGNYGGSGRGNQSTGSYT